MADHGQREGRDHHSDRPRSAGSTRQHRLPRAYHPAGSTVAADVVGLFAERVADYQARVRRCGRDVVPATIRAALAEHSAIRVIVPAGFPVVLAHRRRPR